MHKPTFKIQLYSTYIYLVAGIQTYAAKHNAQSLKPFLTSLFFLRSNSFNYLSYKDCSVFGRTEERIPSLLIPFNESLPQDLFSGIFHFDQVYLEDMYHVTINQLSPMDDCILQVSIQSQCTRVPNSEQLCVIYHRKPNLYMLNFTY